MAADIEDIYREHVTPIWRYVRARLPSDADAEDVTSDVFTRAVRTWDGYDPARGTVAGWLTGIARHAVADWWRRSEQADPVAEVTQVTQADPRAATPNEPEAAALRADGIDELRQHLARLTQREREAVALRFGAELSSPEIGAAMGISPTAARMLVYRAVGKLREVMIDD